MASLAEYTADDVALHKAKHDTWVVIHGKGNG
jgi:cytochrome b involved in lipid metabolism